jgi:pyridoxine 4-dehydrogenase
VQLHWSTARYAPWQEPALIDGLADLVESGAVPSLGLSNVGPKRLRTIHRTLQERGIPISSLQVQFSLLAPQPLADGGIVDTCQELGIELIAYSPLALGLLGRSAGDPRPLPQGTRGSLFRRLESSLAPLRQTMEEIANGRPGGLGAVALNWCRAHGAMPIPGLRSSDQVEQAAAARSWSLSSDERRSLDALAAARMPANPFQSA